MHRVAGTTCFLRMGNDPDENARTVLDFITLQLQQKTAQSNQHFESWGPDAAYTARPWALVFVHDTEALSNAIKDETFLAERQWLESIRVCQVENIHQLQGVLCALHIQEHPQPRSDLLSWIQTERDNQPPCLIVVKDMLRWMDSTNTRSTENRREEVNKTLCLLVETCGYLTNHARKAWDEPFGLQTEQTTDLLITDDAYLNDDDTLYRIISYYCNSIL